MWLNVDCTHLIGGTTLKMQLTLRPCPVNALHRAIGQGVYVECSARGDAAEYHLDSGFSCCSSLGSTPLFVLSLLPESI